MAVAGVETDITTTINKVELMEKLMGMMEYAAEFSSEGVYLRISKHCRDIVDLVRPNRKLFHAIKIIKQQKRKIEFLKSYNKEVLEYNKTKDRKIKFLKADIKRREELAKNKL